MKVQIVKASPLLCWYKNRIGEIFEVTEHENWKDVYKVKGDSIGGILKDDCKIISNENSIARCPNCYHDLKEMEFNGLRDYYCLFCNLYFDDDEIILKDISFFDEMEKRYINEAIYNYKLSKEDEINTKCPYCNCNLFKAKFTLNFDYYCMHCKKYLKENEVRSNNIKGEQNMDKRCPNCGSNNISLVDVPEKEEDEEFCNFCLRYISSKKVDEEDPYRLLKAVLDSALEQASGGKGKERHAKGDENFEDQLMCVVQRLLVDHPVGGLAYQVIKKTIESGRLFEQKGVDAAKAEIYGAINYAAGMNIIYEEQREKSSENYDKSLDEIDYRTESLCGKCGEDIFYCKCDEK